MARPKKGTLLGGGGLDRIRRIFPGDGDASVELALHDSVATEPARLSGTSIRLYSVRRAKNLHPLYREPSAGAKDWEFQGPWEMMVAVEFDQSSDIDVEAGGEGKLRSASATLWLSRKELEDAQAPDPKVGDVFEFWDKDGWKRAGGFQYWDVSNATPHGNIQSTEIFTMWKVSLTSRSTFDPQRKIDNTRI
jgi:hypothetical protein